MGSTSQSNKYTLKSFVVAVVPIKAFRSHSNRGYLVLTICLFMLSCIVGVSNQMLEGKGEAIRK